MSKYRWANGAHVRGDAQAIGVELARLAERGALTPARVVEAARDPASALHPVIFDGTTPAQALRKYHLLRAGHVLRVIKVVEGATETLEVRGFALVEIGGERAYVTAQTAADDPALAQQVRSRLERELRRIAIQLREWSEYAHIVAAIEEALNPAAAA